MELDTGEESSEAEKDNESSESSAETSEKIESSEKALEVDSQDAGDVLALPRVRKMAEEKGIDLASIKTGERITEQELLDYEASETDTESEKDNSVGKVNASPSVRRLAREKGIYIEKVEGTGRGGKITRSDINDAESRDSSQASESRSVDEISGETERRPLSGIEKEIGNRMEKSRFTAPHVTHVEKVDVKRLSEMREREKDEVDPHLTYLPFIMKAAVSALKDYPELNAELDEENDDIVLKNFYCFNIAVDTDRGLMVPKIKNVDRKSIVKLADEVSEKAEKARNGDLTPEEMSIGSFSISNIGAIGGEAFTPIINYPQTAILGVGKISETAEVFEGEVEPRMTVKLSLSYDHRVIDGATAARFMNKVAENLENPEKMLIEL
ncbi:dihydrolipoamide acetyltransferase family protein [Candidatus Nanosalina sp. VS9-1]|uniref:dihydrolipoamide acetyltransferase family protein n=1 Tax=Candidatus Nanosalina sp. VS9-1 TaxID=3388566 RepID=UPI0039DF47DE